MEHKGLKPKGLRHEAAITVFKQPSERIKRYCFAFVKGGCVKDCFHLRDLLSKCNT